MNDVANVLALVQGQDTETVEADLPVPPCDSSEKATALWYGLLGEYEFSIGELVILEQLVNTQTHLDEIETAWRRDGSETTSLGSTGQVVTEPRIQEMRQLRGQIASLIKALNLPAEGGQERRRPGRPTRWQAAMQGNPSHWAPRH